MAISHKKERCLMYIPLNRFTGAQSVGPSPIPIFTTAVSAGFPSAAEEWIEEVLSIDELLIKRPSATFLLRVSGESMTGAGIIDGAVLVVDRSIDPKPGHIVVASVSGDFTVKRLMHGESGHLVLCPANDKFQPITLTEDSMVWGVVTAAINQFGGQ